jgi:hypothetical protein
MIPGRYDIRLPVQMQHKLPNGNTINHPSKSLKLHCGYRVFSKTASKVAEVHSADFRRQNPAKRERRRVRRTLKQKSRALTRLCGSLGSCFSMLEVLGSACTSLTQRTACHHAMPRLYMETMPIAVFRPKFRDDTHHSWMRIPQPTFGVVFSV